MNSPHCVIHEFLGANLFRQLVSLIVERQGLFRTRGHDGEGWRELEEFGALKKPLVAVLLEAWRDVAPRCGLPSLDAGEVEICVKSLGGSPDTGHRDPTADEHELGFVLFLHREPRPFEGGALHLHARMGEIVIEPSQNSIVFFAGSIHVQSGPIRAPSAALIDSRLTLEGRIRGHPGGPV